ncbi:beta-ketoacyl synthase N-terminal-like domain-containing protein [Mycobacterium shigaense]|uniref:beta-ketoacyl synthase N-terminal-like domain-containing protein n=1 Tax=Mycobacterium shigaense TaxID=722731 RepID=UPI002AE011AE|nr:beta-ketoacyl synthase N-terminal-like domain-containing protein [Mycobacterium shigaense]MEA1124395.1 beta-ketoacyl synthase N-terminal-like domain-containing protein [Mycobacterium shigaense]
MKFEPIAIVGQGCVLPGGLNPDELWTTVCEGRDVLGSPRPDYWGVSPTRVLRDQRDGSYLDHTWSDRGGYVRGFEDVFDGRGLLLGAADLDGLDPLYLWAIEAARQALASAGWTAGAIPGSAGVVLGNLSYPTKSMTDLAEKFWRGTGHGIDWRNRFMSGLPAHLIANALGLTAGAAALDAACASSIYAIKLACDRLHDGTADVMLAGGVNGASDLLLHVGFSALQALSRTGRSRPFHQGADGLVPAEGAAILILRRLDDAIAAGQTILGVIRGIGLSNDGRGRGLLVPSQDGQERAMQAAYQMADLEPQDISLVECHATGTSRGDLTELMSMARIFAGMANVPIGSLKSNLGHSITASGAAGAIKVLAAMRAGVRPPTLHVDDPLPFIAGSPFRLLEAAEPWVCVGPRRAAINNFGFGGNNAHLLLEEWIEPAEKRHARVSWPVTGPPSEHDIAIVGLSLLVGDGHETASVADHLMTGQSIPCDDGGRLRARMSEVSLDLTRTRFPPADLKQTQPQQLALLGAALNIDEVIKGLPPDTTSVVVGMGCDAEVTRFGVRWRLADEIDDPDDLAAARDEVVQGWTAAGVVGAMPNIVANRLNSQFDLRGPSFTVSREELSGTTALELAARALRRGEVDAAVVGAVDLSCESVHEAAVRVLLGPGEQVPGDAAVVVVLKRADDARRDHDTILATLPANQQPRGECLHLGTAPGALNLSPLLGHAHAASGLLHVAAGVLYGFLGVWPDGTAWATDERAVVVALAGIAGQEQQIVLLPPPPGHRDAGARGGQIPPAARPRTGKPTQLSFPAHLPEVRLPARVAAASRTALNPVTAEHLTTHHLEQLMATYVPLPPPLPRAAEALTRVPLGEALIAQTPPEPLAMVYDLDSEIAVATAAEASAQRAVALPDVQIDGMPVPTATTALEPSVHNDVDKPFPKGASRAIQPTRPAGKEVPAPTVKRAPVGLTLDKDGLRVHASGKISEIYGPAFAVQDDYLRQVRMPEPPLLLADRLLGIDAEPAKFGTGTLWTETDVTADAWWLHQGRMPAGIMIEAGQADLMLISWMGADFLNKSERVYRLLGCEVTYLGGLPEIGDTLRFDIHVDGHARQGDIRMFFFHYDCTIDGVERMSMRNGQAGFFSDQELAASGGILWRPEDETVDGPMEPTPAQTARTSLRRADLEAVAAGDIWHTFGAGFERAASHTRTPSIAGGDMLFVDEVTQLDLTGGPWGRGYLRAVEHINPEKWYFGGHFKNDPCMPGTLMYEATMQTMAIYMTALGMTIGCDGWRFEPVPFETYKLVCRGQVTPQSRELVYEVFVREVIAGPEPTLFADLLCTVDGLPAFHCRRMGLRLSPGWPMDMGAKELEEYVEPKAVAAADGFAFDYQAMLASATAKPSMAFGPLFEKFDSHRKVARLPGPPYHFMSRVTELVGDIGVVKFGAEAVVEYDVPSDAWYFAANGAPTMPNAVLMEVALQPCGWLASYVGCPLDSEVDLYFRNLDGNGTQHLEITPSIGTLRTKISLTSIAKAAGTIIVSFVGEIHAHAGLVYSFDTVFGYFRSEALQNQVGLPVSDEQRSLVELACDAPVVELRERPRGFFGPGPRLAEPMLLMIDRVTGRWPTDGAAGLGRWRAVKDVDPAEWFFKAHFCQDPVQPGSLGIEMLLQLLQFAMLDLGLGKEAGPSARFEPVAQRDAITWRYRGQIIPTNKQITSQVEITRIGRADDGILAVAEASLWVDGKRIYSASNLGMRITRDAPDGRFAVRAGSSGTPVETPAATTVETVIDPARDTWITDHCPTYVIPSLPMMSILDLFAEAAGAACGPAKVVEVTDLRVVGWVVVDSPKRLRVAVEPAGPGRFAGRLEAWRDAPNPVLSRWETHATATIVTADQYAGAPVAPAPLRDAVPFATPYDGAVFHGPAFASLIDGARIGRNGSSGTLDVQRCTVPAGRLQPGLLDGALHVVPHAAMSVWTTDGTDVASYAEAPDPTVAFPRCVECARFYGATPVQGTVDVETRFVGFDDADGRMPIIDLWLSVAGKPWAYLRLVEILLPKGPLAEAGGPRRLAFLGQRRAVPAMSLSERLDHGVVALDSARAATLDWFRGTLQAVYRTDSQGDSLLADIATKEAVADAAHGAIHPSQVQFVNGLPNCPVLPLERVTVEVDARPGRCRASASLQTDWQPVRRWWADLLGLPRDGFGDLLHWALLSRYVRHVIVTDPAAMSAIRGRPVLLLGNHQVQVESLLGTTIASWATGTRVMPIANAKHENRWIGQLLQLLDIEAGRQLGAIRYFDQQHPQQFLRLMDEIKSDVADRGVSTLVHADGTRAVHSGQRVERLTSTLLDMAVEASVPIVPVYFAGGLPIETLDRKLEVPYRHAAQDYIFGRPIMPDELAGWAYAQRRHRVIDAINALAPFSDAPHEPNVAVEQRINARVPPDATPLESVWACIEDALDGLAANWRDMIGDDWAAARSTQRHTADTGTGRQ